MESPSRPRAARSPAAAQAGEAGCLGRNWAGKALEPGRQQLSADQQRALVAKGVNCIGTLRAAAGRRRSLLWDIWETVSGELSSILSCTVQGRHCCTGVGWLEVLQKTEGDRTQDVSKILILKPEEMFLFQLKEKKAHGTWSCCLQLPVRWMERERSQAPLRAIVEGEVTNTGWSMRNSSLMGKSSH